MPRRPKKQAPSLNPKGSSKNQAKFSPEKLKGELQAAFESGDDSRVLELLDSAPPWMRNQPEFLLFRASILLSLGREQEAMRLLLEIERKDPRFIEVYTPLAMLYMDWKYPAHALQSAKRAFSNRNLVDESRESLERLISEATSELQYLATKFGISMEIMHQASIYHEKALMAMDDERLMDADFYAQKAIELIPAWNSPHNNRAHVLYFTGKPREAIEIVEAVLARDAVNVFALDRMTTFYYGLDQIEQARVYAGRLDALMPQFSTDSLEMEHVITALALVEDTAALWKIARKYLDRPADAIIGRSWHCLAVAAARSGKWKNALDLMHKAAEKDRLSPAAEKFMDQLKVVKRLRPPRLAWMPPKYPGVDLFLNAKVISELRTFLSDSSNRLSPSQQRKLGIYLQKYPFVETALKRLLWEEDGYRLALSILPNLNQPDVDAEIVRFALSQAGTQEARVQAIMALIEAERYTGPKVIKFWNEELQEWREVSLNAQRIGNIPPKARPETLVFIEKAHRAKKPKEAISLLRKAVEIEPTSAMAMFNLGVMLVQNGHAEEGEALIQNSVTVDPGYTYGHASIALAEAEKGNEQAALDHLESVTQADLIATDTAVIANLAWCVLALRKRDLKTARQHFDLAAKLNPEHHLLKDYETNLEVAEDFGSILEYQHESAMRSHRKLLRTALTAETTLRACLETNTRDMLAGSAKFLHISSAGRKGELISRLAHNLLDKDFLQATLEEDLAEKEREAIRWILEAGGVRPWNEFVRRYGDDMYESTYWVFNIPDSIPGHMKLSGLLFSGTLVGQQVAFIPPDIRPLLLELIK